MFRASAYFVVGTIVAYAIPRHFLAPSSACTIAAGLLQLLGIVTIVFRLHARWRFASQKGLFDGVKAAIRRVYRRIVRRAPKVVYSENVAFQTGSDVQVTPGSAHLRYLRNLNERVDALEAELREFKKETRQTSAETRQQVKKLDDKRQQFASAVNARFVEVEKESRRHEGEGLSLDLVGVLWVMLGIVLQTWPGPIGSFLSALGL